MRIRNLTACITAFCLAMAGPLLAQEEKDEGQLLVEDFLQNIVTISGRFEQQLLDADDNVVEESSGTLNIRRPGQFRWSYFDPYQQILVADGPYRT